MSADARGEHGLRLDADRARDELEATLDEIERRLDPRALAAAAGSAVRAHPLPAAAIGVGVAAAAAIAAWLAARARRG